MAMTAKTDDQSAAPSEAPEKDSPLLDLSDAAVKKFIKTAKARGFVTKRQDPKTQVGYCHGLGHGVGLEIHERPSIHWLESNRDVFAPGMVFTIEPGLYYPDEEIGVRLEDTFHLRPDGTLEAVFEGDPDAVESLVRLCQEGPRGAEVDRVEVFEEEPEGLSRFDAR